MEVVLQIKKDKDIHVRQKLRRARREIEVSLEWEIYISVITVTYFLA